MGLFDDLGKAVGGGALPEGGALEQGLGLLKKFL